MATVKQKHVNERFDSLLRRFKKAVDNDNIIKEYRNREFYSKPSLKRKAKRAAAIKRAEKQHNESVMLKTRLY